MVFILDPSWLTSEVHFHIKYKMTIWICICRWCWFSIFQYLESYQNLVHIFCNGILRYRISVFGFQLFWYDQLTLAPQSETCFFCLLSVIWNQWFYPSFLELMSPATKMRVHLKCLFQLKNPLPQLGCIPSEYWRASKLLFCPQLDEDFLSYCQLSQLSDSPGGNNEGIGFGYSWVVSLVIYDSI